MQIAPHGVWQVNTKQMPKQVKMLIIYKQKHTETNTLTQIHTHTHMYSHRALRTRGESFNETKCGWFASMLQVLLPPELQHGGKNALACKLNRGTEKAQQHTTNLDASSSNHATEMRKDCFCFSCMFRAHVDMRAMCPPKIMQQI